ncbi:ABC transporter substrate-binding protein [Actinomadura craniellae]|nr:ABC transporter substrate-binding protein [Actinomadura craniellae]
MTRIRGRVLAGSVALIAAFAPAACSSGDGDSSSGATIGSDSLPQTKLTTLKVGWSYQDMTLDPATFYGSVGFATMGALYEGLVAYAPRSGEIVPQLATKWKVSPDGLTYTFTLREGATFHDGTPVDAEAFRYSFQRFIDVKGAPSYMLGDVAKFQTPDPKTFVIELKKPNNALLDYLASYVGPKAMSPTLLKANAGRDNGQTFLVKNDAGSGPYVLSDVVIDKGLTLKAAPKYWGEKPKIPQIQVSVVPDITDQVLRLRNGDLDLIDSQVPPNLAQQLRKDGNLSVTAYASVVKPTVWIKDSGIFRDKATREALIQAVDRSVIAKGAFGAEATPSKSLIPITMVGGDITSDDPGYDPSKLKSIVGGLGSIQPIVVGYRDSLARDALAAQLIQTQLQAAGLNATVRGYGPEFYGFAADTSKAPDLMVLGINSDANTPAAWLKAYFATGGSLTMNGVSTPAGDEALNKAIAATDPAEAKRLYGEAATAYADSAFFFTLADVKSYIYAHKKVGPVPYTAANPFGPYYAEVGEAP